VTRAIPTLSFLYRVFSVQQNPEPKASSSTQNRAPSTQFPAPSSLSVPTIHIVQPYIKRLKVHVHVRSCETHEATSSDAQPPRRSVQHLSRLRARPQAPSVHYPHLQHRQHPRQLHFLISLTCKIHHPHRHHPKFNHHSHQSSSFPCQSPGAPSDGQGKETTSFPQDNSYEKSTIKLTSVTLHLRSGK
jgi:hypothetical protein